jgi:hypothetical protein
MKYDVDIKRNADGTIDLAYYDEIGRNVRGSEMRAVMGRAWQKISRVVASLASGLVRLTQKLSAIDFQISLKIPA